MKRKNRWKLFRLPSPSELGMTDDEEYDALPMKMFQNAGDTTPTWEDWEDRVKKDYPIRFFFAEELVPWFKRKYRRWITDPIYWLKCHTLPSHKFHLIDIREPKGNPLSYRSGWIDCDHQMVLALFAILNGFVEKELPHAYIPSEEDVASEPHLLNQRNNYLEVKAIHYWWNVQRVREEEAHSQLLTAWDEAKKNNFPTAQQLWKELNEDEERNKEKLEEMMIRLLKVRHCMWT